MAASNTQTLAAARKRCTILRLALASGTAGLTICEIHAATNIPTSTIGTALREFRDDGMVEASQPNGGQGNRWGAPGTHAAYESANPGRMAKLKAKRAQRNRCAARKRVDAEVVGGFDRASIVRIVPAHLAEPLRPRGPSSVWALGVVA